MISDKKNDKKNYPCALDEKGLEEKMMRQKNGRSVRFSTRYDMLLGYIY